MTRRNLWTPKVTVVVQWRWRSHYPLPRGVTATDRSHSCTILNSTGLPAQALLTHACTNTTIRIGEGRKDKPQTVSRRCGERNLNIRYIVLLLAPFPSLRSGGFGCGVSGTCRGVTLVGGYFAVDAKYSSVEAGYSLEFALGAVACGEE